MPLNKLKLKTSIQCPFRCNEVERCPPVVRRVWTIFRPIPRNISQLFWADGNTGSRGNFEIAFKNKIKKKWETQILHTMTRRGRITVTISAERKQHHAVYLSVTAAVSSDVHCELISSSALLFLAYDTFLLPFLFNNQTRSYLVFVY